MSLGQHIYTLRTKQNLTQSDLADALEVSRQSISKWETDGAVPELDKLVKLSELFGVTLDELVKGPSAAPDEPAPRETPSAPPAQSRFPLRKLAGLLLLCTAFLGFLYCVFLSGRLTTGLVYTSPIWLCGVACLLFRRHLGLYCAWGLWIAANLIFGDMGGYWSILFFALFERGWLETPQFFIALILLLGYLALGLASALLHRKTPLTLTARKRGLLWAAWPALLALFPAMGTFHFFLLARSHQLEAGCLRYGVRLFTAGMSAVPPILFALLLTVTLRWRCTKQHDSSPAE